MIHIKRMYLKNCTLGILTYKDFRCFVLELPWINNEKDISCILKGTHKAFKRFSPGKQYDVIEYESIPGRTFIQAHGGNFTRQLLGCQLYGDSIKFLDGDDIPDITNTRDTLRKLLEMLPDKFEINIS